MTAIIFSADISFRLLAFVMPPLFAAFADTRFSLLLSPISADIAAACWPFIIDIDFHWLIIFIVRLITELAFFVFDSTETILVSFHFH
jgi:hypothetical protein